MTTTVTVSVRLHVDRALVRAPADADREELAGFVSEVVRAADQAGRAGGPAVAAGIMRPR